MLNLESARKKRNMSQSDLARAIGCSQVAVHKFEAGQINPSLETLVKISKVLDVPLDELVIKEESA